MRWSDERYVRVYTRDTPEWCVLSWEARAVFMHLLRVVDRAGIIRIGRGGTRSLAALLRVPVDVLERAVPELCEDGCISLSGDVLCVPNFMAAQEASASDAARKRAERERAAARAAALRHTALTSAAEDERAPSEPPASLVAEAEGASRTVTECHEGAQPRHEPSRSVTPSQADPSLTEPGQTETSASPPPLAAPVGSAAPAQEGTRGGSEEPPRPQRADARAAQVVEVLEHWASALYPGRRPNFDEKRRGKVRARLFEGFSAEELKLAIDGCARSPFHVEKGFKDIELICRDSAHVERFISIARGEVKPGGPLVGRPVHVVQPAPPGGSNWMARAANADRLAGGGGS